MQTLPATLQQEQERKLKALRLEHQQKGMQERERKMSTKYKMVKFVEHKKVARRMAQLEKREGAGEHVAEALELCRKQLRYIEVSAF